MTKQPLVSVVMPAHNSEKYIGIAIESVQRQTYDNWELIIVDDCSRDSTQDIVLQYDKDKRIKLITLKKNIGIAGARNKAIKQACGKYIAFLDSDDLWLPDKLDVQISYMEATGSKFTFTYYQVIDENDNLIRTVKQAPARLNYTNLLKSNSIGLLTVIVSNKLVKKELMPNIPHEDYATWLNILHKGYTAILIPSLLAKYRVQNNSRSSNKFASMLWTWSIYRKNQHKNLLSSLYYLIYYIYFGIKKHL